MELTFIAIITVLVLFLVYLFYRLNRANTALAETSEQLQKMQLEFAVLEERSAAESEASRQKIALLKDAKEELRIQFENLANTIFENKQKSFDEKQRHNLESLLKPFREQLSEFSKASEERFIKDTKERFVLKDEIERLRKLNEQISQDAVNLTNALKGENKVQGNWGEMVLERILEESGLRKNHEYETQMTLNSSEGKSFRPDAVVHLPEQKDIIIDSKVSLVAYENYFNATEEEQRVRALKEHVRSIQNHIKLLSTKRYEKLEGINTLDFVLLFMPLDGAFILAVEHDSQLLRYAYENNIMLVSPSTLLITLRTVEYIWRIERQEEHAQEIINKAEALYDKLVLFVDEMVKVGDGLQSASKSYDIALNRLKSGRGNLIKRAEDMKAMGLKPKKQLSIQSDEDNTPLY